MGDPDVVDTAQKQARNLQYEVEVASEGVEEESAQVESEGAEEIPEAISVAEGEALQPNESLSTDDSSS